MNITKQHLVDRVAHKTGFSKTESKIIIDNFLDTVKETVAEGNRIELRGFGVYKSKHRKPKIGRNPKTGIEVPIDEAYVPVFKPSIDFVNQVHDTLIEIKS